MSQDLSNGWSWVQAHLAQIKERAKREAPRLRGRLEEDDVVQICLIYMAERAEDFDPKRGTPGAFIRVSVRAAVKAAGRRRVRVNVWADEDHSEWLSDPRPAPDLWVYAREVLDKVPEDRRPLVIGLAEGYTASEFPHQFGVTRHYARQWARQTAARLEGDAR